MFTAALFIHVHNWKSLTCSALKVSYHIPGTEYIYSYSNLHIQGLVEMWENVYGIML